MLLTIWDSIRDYLQNSISLGSVLALLIGILVGMLLAFLLYLIVIVIDIKKSEKEVKNVPNNDENEEIEKTNKVNEYIENSISRYDDICKGKELGEKYNEVKDIVTTLVVDIAKVYYPDSKHPLAELTVEEAVMLDRYIMERIEGIFSRKTLRFFYNKKISTALTILDKKKQIEETKLIKSAKKYHVTDVFGTISNVLHAVNPGYWFRKGVIDNSVSFTSNKIFKAIIRIIGSETAKIYSKNVFNVDDEKIDEELETEDNIIEVEE